MSFASRSRRVFGEKRGGSSPEVLCTPAVSSVLGRGRLGTGGILALIPFISCHATSRSASAPAEKFLLFAQRPWAARFEAEVVRPRDEARRKVERELAHCGRALEQVVAAREEERVEQHLVERHDFETNAWEAVAPMAEARYEHAVAVLDGTLYAVGGYIDDDDDALNSVERYDPAVGVWEAVAPMTTARESHGMAVLDGKLYAVGGRNDDDGALSSVERYDPALDAWESVAPMAEARFYPTAAVRRGRPEARPQPRLPQLGRAVRSDNQRVGGGGGADDVGADEWFRCWDEFSSSGNKKETRPTCTPCERYTDSSARRARRCRTPGA